jgi:hypothetical protein
LAGAWLARPRPLHCRPPVVNGCRAEMVPRGATRVIATGLDSSQQGCVGALLRKARGGGGAVSCLWQSFRPTTGSKLVLAGSGSAGGGPAPGLHTIRRNGAGAAVHPSQRLRAGVATYFSPGHKGLCAQNDSSQPGSIRRKGCVWGCAQPILGVGAGRRTRRPQQDSQPCAAAWRAAGRGPSTETCVGRGRRVIWPARAQASAHPSCTAVPSPSRAGGMVAALRQQEYVGPAGGVGRLPATGGRPFLLRPRAGLCGGQPRQVVQRGVPEPVPGSPPMNEVTRVLSAIEQGNPHAAGQLMPLVHDELRRITTQKVAPEDLGRARATGSGRRRSGERLRTWAGAAQPLRGRRGTAGGGGVPGIWSAPRTQSQNLVPVLLGGGVASPSTTACAEW